MYGDFPSLMAVMHRDFPSLMVVMHRDFPSLMIAMHRILPLRNGCVQRDCPFTLHQFSVSRPSVCISMAGVLPEKDGNFIPIMFEMNLFCGIVP